MTVITIIEKSIAGQRGRGEDRKDGRAGKYKIKHKEMKFPADKSLLLLLLSRFPLLLDVYIYLALIY
jgi:hypothetical protein